MASSINTVALTGNLSRNPELKKAGETDVAEFGLAVNRRVKKGDEWEDAVSFVECVVFSGLAKVVAEYCKQGNRVSLSGELRQDRWENEAGEKRSKVYVVARDLVIPTKAENTGGSNPAESDDDPFAD